MSDENIKYTLYHESTDEVIQVFVGNGNVEEYPDGYREMAERADTDATFSHDIDGTRYTGLRVKSEPYDV